ncbi:MAG: hypothetical protein ACFE9Z_09210 [Promethearchaeota archaeon]
MIANQIFLEFRSELLKIKDKKKLEKAYYNMLSKCLKSGQFKAFEMLIDASIEFNIFIDVSKIPNHFNAISNLIVNCIDKITTRYQTSALGEILDILIFCNDYGLLERELSNSEKQNIYLFKKENKIFLENLKDIFKRVSDSLIFYVYRIIPREIYNYFVTSSISFFTNREALTDYIKNSFFDQYTIYGLSIRNLCPIENLEYRKTLSPIERFFEDFHKKLKETQLSNNNLIEMDITYKYQIFFYDTEEEHEQLIEKKHLISPKNILKNKQKILDKNNYNFYSISMVLLGGLGPQGLGFTYSTPKGEIVEICSDQKESEAIIIEYKEYLKRKFLLKLEEELGNLGINHDVKNRIIKFLSEILNPKEMINYHKKEQLLEKIKKAIEQIDEFQGILKPEFNDLINKISKALSLILRRIKLRDQFITRMDLVVEGKIKSEDIAKLTSLKGKSHYDVLRERFFFQHITDWFYEIYHSKEIKEIKKK